MTSSKSLTAPIVLFVYNRPDHVRRGVKSLQANYLAKESDLFIFSDAPKSNKDREAVTEVRKFIHHVDGFRNITIIERDENWGLARSIIDGVTIMTKK